MSQQTDHDSTPTEGRTEYESTALALDEIVKVLRDKVEHLDSIAESLHIAADPECTALLATAASQIVPTPPPTAAPEPPQDIREQIGRIMHESWCKTKRAQHFHHPDEPCDICGDGKGLCMVHRDLVPWEQLPEKQKDINRHAFDAVLESGILVPAAPAPTAKELK